MGGIKRVLNPVQVPTAQNPNPLNPLGRIGGQIQGAVSTIGNALKPPDPTRINPLNGNPLFQNRTVAAGPAQGIKPPTPAQTAASSMVAPPAPPKPMAPPPSSTPMPPSPLAPTAPMGPSYDPTGSPEGYRPPPVQPQQKNSIPFPGDLGGTVAPTQPSQLDALQKAYMASLGQSPEEIAANTAIGNLATSKELGLQNIANQPIEMNYLTGQSAALERSAANKALPLQTQLAALQAQREAQQAQAKAALGFEQERITGEKPIEVGGSLVRLNPATGQYEEVYKGASGGGDPVTLSENQVLVDRTTGKQIASGNAKTFAPEGTPASYKEWQLAGGQGSYADFLASSGGKPLDTGALTRISDTQTGLSSLEELGQIISANGALFGPVVGNRALNPWDTSARNVQSDVDRVRQLVGKALEGGVLRKEDEEKYKKIIPTMYDTPETAAYKIEQLRNLLTNQIDTIKSNYGAAGRSFGSGVGGQSTGSYSDSGSGFAEEW